MIEIPSTLISRLAIVGTQRFIRVAQKGKQPVDSAWQKQENLRSPDNAELNAWLESNGNYGVVGGHGLIIIDADNAEIDQVCQTKLPATFTVQSPGSKMHHRYYRSNLSKPLRLKDKDGENIGDIQGEGKQVLGPGSIHPNGGTYQITGDQPLAYVNEQTIRTILNQWIIKESIIQQAIQAAQTEASTITLSISDVLNHYGIKLHTHGDELYGPHPIHGSTNGQNFWVNPAKNCWHCFRCSSGGGPLSLIAMREGIIQCSQATKGALRGDIFLKTLRRGQELGLIEKQQTPILMNGRKITYNPEDFFTKKDDGTIKTFVPQHLANKIQEQHKFASLDKYSDIYYYDENRGTWYPKGEILIRGLAYLLLDQLAKRYYIEETVALIRDTNYIPREKLDHDINRLPLENGVLNIITLEIEAFSHTHYALTHIPVKYDPTATCPQTLKFIAEICPHDQETLQEWIGYHLLRDYRYQKCVQLIGEGNNGKSTFLRLLESFLGKDNVSNATLYELVSGRFAKADLYGKLANIASDISPDELKRTGAFKAFTGGDYVRAELKHQNAFKFLNYAKLSFSANRLPPTPDESDAFFRRWILISFPNTFDPPNCDPTIINKITTPEELSGLLNWAIQGLRRLRQNGEFTNSQSTENLRQTWILLSDPITRFLKEYTIDDVNGFIPKAELHAAFCKFCAEKKAPPMTRSDFTRKLKDKKTMLGVSKLKVGNTRKECWTGISLNASDKSNKSISNILFKSKIDQNHFKKVKSSRTSRTSRTDQAPIEEKLSLQEKMEQVLIALRTFDKPVSARAVQMKTEIPSEEIRHILELLERDKVAFHNMANQWRAVI